jgi:hypothetical protein
MRISPRSGPSSRRGANGSVGRSAVIPLRNGLLVTDRIHSETVHVAAVLLLLVRRVSNVMNRLLTVCAGAAVLVLAACSSSTPSPAATSASPIDNSAAVAPGPVASLGPLALGHFPSTTDGKLAKAICKSWSALRSEYVQKITADTAYQLNGWFSSSDWSTIQNDGMTLGSDPAYSNLETALGVGMVGDDASAASAKAIDKACKEAD